MSNRHNIVAEVFELDPLAWSPRTSILILAERHFRDFAEPNAYLPSNQDILRGLRSLGFVESKRKGIRGFVGIRTPDNLADTRGPAHGTLRTYRSGCRCQECRDYNTAAVALARVARRNPDLAEPAEPYNPFLIPAEPTEFHTPIVDDDSRPLSSDDPRAYPGDSYSRSTRNTVILTKRAEATYGPAERWTCSYCGHPANTVDHFIPWTVSHDSTPENLRPACTRCQQSKGDKYFDDWVATRGW